MASPRHVLVALACSVLAACSVGDPVPLEEDSAYASWAETRAIAPRIAIAPVDVSRGVVWDRPPSSFGVAPLTTLGERPAFGARSYSWNATGALDAQRVQRRLARVLAFALQGGGEVPRLKGADPAALLAAADHAGAQLLVTVDVDRARAAWVERNGLVWWSNLFLFYVPGIFPVVLIPDEVYEVSLRARVQVVHARTGYRLLGKDFVATHRESLNDAQRGWSLSGLLFLYPLFLDRGDYQAVFQELFPHACKELERQVATWLRRALPKRLTQPPVRRLLELGDPRRARTHALVIGADAPNPKGPRLSMAASDARAVARLLRSSGTVDSTSRLRVLIGESATTRAVLRALKELRADMLGHDRLLVYFSGFGSSDALGAPQLHLRGAPLFLTDLARHCEQVAHPESPVLFLLDTSFGGKGGRTYPGGRRVPHRTALDPLWNSGSRWRVLTASAPRSAAGSYSEPAQGRFTYWLLRGVASGSADEDHDRRITTGELGRYLRRQLPRYGPSHLGGKSKVAVFRRPRWVR